MLLQHSIEHVSIVYTCNTYFVMHWPVLFIRRYLVNVLIQYPNQKLMLLGYCIHTFPLFVVFIESLIYIVNTAVILY